MGSVVTRRIKAQAAAQPSAWAMLFGRYGAVGSWAWRNRLKMDGVARTGDERAFLPAALSLQETPVHPAPRRTAYLLMTLFALALAWACYGTLDVVAVAPGRIIVSERSKVIQPLERSVVKHVLVRDGDHVVAGQVLVELDATTAKADTARLQAQVQASGSDVLRARLLQQALADPRRAGPAWPGADGLTAPSVGPLVGHTMVSKSQGGADLPALSVADRAAAAAQMDAEWRDIQARLDRLAAELRHRQAESATVREDIAKLEATLPLARKREDDFKALTAQGFVAHHAGQDRTRERIELERDLSTRQARLQEALAGIDESASTRAAYLAETRRALGEREAHALLLLRQATQEIAKASQREKLTVLTAPVSGQVQQLVAHTSGGVVTEAQPLMVIVPDEAPGAPVVAEVALENKDIGFVRAGQAAEIKFETFAYTRYGTVPATVQLVTADAVTDEKRGAIFPARLVLSASRIDVDGKQIRLSPGMNVTAEIKTGQRRVIEYLLSPIQRAAGEGLRER